MIDPLGILVPILHRARISTGKCLYALESSCQILFMKHNLLQIPWIIQIFSKKGRPVFR